MQCYYATGARGRPLTRLHHVTDPILAGNRTPPRSTFASVSDRDLMLSLLGLLLVLVLGSTLDVMEVDAAQYASMSLEMLGSDDPLKLHHRGKDYLDKPPLLFWLSAASFRLFGVHDWSYRLPSILFAVLGVYSTYRFTRRYHGSGVARTAALMFASSATFLLMTNDVRTDTILTASVITAIWAGMAWVDSGRWWPLLICSIAIAAGMLVKGPMGLMAPALAIGGHMVMARRWDRFTDARLLIAAMVIALLLVPMCIGLYEQHGAHGLRFYFWEQSFGRLTGENRWKDDSTVLFFTHELIWLMLPWTIFTLVGLWRSAREQFISDRGSSREGKEYASFIGPVAVFVALSFSQFKLPHYLYVTIPLFSVLSARTWHNLKGASWFRSHMVVMFLLWIAAMVLVAWSFPSGGGLFIILLIAVIPTAWYMLRTDATRWGVFRASMLTMVAIGICINGQVYPHLLAYQANAQVGRIVREEGVDATHFFGLQRSGTALDFYAGFPVPWLSDVREASEVIAPGVLIWTDAQHLKELREAGFDPVEVRTFPDHPVQIMALEMLHPDLRATVLEEGYLLRF